MTGEGDKGSDKRYIHTHPYFLSLTLNLLEQFPPCWTRVLYLLYNTMTEGGDKGSDDMTGDMT